MSSSIQHVQTALQSLRKAATKGKTKKSVLENIDNVSSSIVLLNSSAPSAHAFDKLVSVFRVPLVPLYSNYTEASLNVASAVLKVVLNNGIRPCLLEGDYRDIERQMGWERVAHSLLSGVIDFIESDNNEKTKTCVAKALYAPICNFFFFKDKSAKTEIGANLRCTAYMLLSDTSTLHHDNQARLRDQRVLGGRALGLAISKTRDFVVLETLLNLFAILLPSCSMPKEKHSAYIRDVFSDCRKEIAELLDYIPTREWDETATKVVDILSASDISFPQPFDVDEIVVCDNKYPQPEISDRFYIDRMSFFVNVQQEDGMYESLQIAYTNVKEIKITSSGAKEKTTSVNVTLKAIPMIGDQALSTGADSLTLLVEILNSDMPRFKEALQHRNLGAAIAGAKRSRVSVSESALLDFDEDGMRWEEATHSPSQKAKDVESFYESEPFQAPIDQLHAVKDDVLPDIVSIARTVGAPPEKVESKNSGRPSAIPKLNASVFGGTDEDLSDINKAESVPTLDVKIKSVKAGKKVPAAPATSKPAQVIILSDNDAATEIKPAPRGGKGSKRRPQRRVDSDEEEATKESKSELAREEKQARSVKFNSSAKIAASKKAPNSASRAKGKPAVEKKAEKATKTDDGNIPAGRPRRAAATTASAKLATAFADSEDTNTFEAPQDDDPLFNAKNAIEDTLESADPSPTVQEPFTKTFKAAQTAKKTQTAKPYIRAPVPLQNIAPRSSSPISKISRMKAKNPPEKAKFVKTRAQKRTTDQAFAADDQKISSRKKPRVDIENVNQGEDEGDNLNADHPRIDTSHPPLKYGHRGRKAKASPALQSATVDWDQVPTEASVAIMTKQREESSPIVPLKMTSPVKASVKKKENTSESKGISKKSTALAPKKPEAKPRPRDRTPLQAIVQVPNEASEEPEHVVRSEEQLPKNAPVNKELKNRQPANTAPAREKARLKESILPSLEDILLKGAIVEKVEVEQAENVEVDDEIITYDNGDAESKFKIGYAEDFSFPIMDLDEGPVDRGEGQQGQTDKRVADLQDEPRTPMPKKKAMDSSPIPNVFNSQPSKKAPELDVEMIDLTDEDVKEVLQSLRARRAKSRHELGEATRLQESTRGSPIANDERESPPEGHDAPDMQEMLSRPKVKFDDNLRYKSASLESLTGQQSAESLIVGNGTKHRLPGSKHASRGPIESTSRKRQESQMKKEPGMEEIVNVLDAIQNVVLSNIANKSRAVRSDIRTARDRLIHEAVADLHEMREESIGHYNNLFTLESEYANMNRKLNTGLETVTNVNTDICKFVRQTINAHDRGSLSKKMPQSLYNSALPQSFLKFT